MLRKVKRFEEDSWVGVDFMSLKVGDFFKLFDEGPMPYEDGSKTFQAVSSPYINDMGIGEIQCEEVL